MLELNELNLFYHDIPKLDEYGLVSLVPTNENIEILESAVEQYRKNTTDDEFVGRLGENCAYLKDKFGPCENQKGNKGKIYLLKRVS